MPLFAILYQSRLLAKDLADTPVFVAALLLAFTAALFLAKKEQSPGKAIPVLLLIPWIVRLFIAFPRLFFPGMAITLDSLLLNLDRNNFVFLLPFYWAALTTYFSVRSRVFLRADIILQGTLLTVLFCITPTAEMEAYRWPILMIAVFTGILLLQIVAFILSLPPEYRLRRQEGISGGIALFILIILGGVLFIRPSQEKAVEKGGGLLEPQLFRFDFSQFMRLETEISINDDLILIMKKDPDTHILLRRYVLSGYTPKQGFFRLDNIDEKAHPQRLPNRKTALDMPPPRRSRITNQEYYLVNFDSSALVAMNQPSLITPFETWDASSFSAAYSVQSYTSEARVSDLNDAVREKPTPENLERIPGLSPEEYALYTEYGKNEEIAAFAREITQGLGRYRDMIQRVYETLKYGEYRYSLKPGIAPDGDQLSFFLFESKKGYCSYYAFSMALLLRSLGIPTRVAAGFFIDPKTNLFDYYPVRADMAHAWVEVYFPEYGWIEYDPTSEDLAEGEEFRFSSGVPPELFERLMKEIFDNRSRLIPKEGEDGEDDKTAPGIVSLGKEALRFLRESRVPLAVLLIGLVFLNIRAGPLLSSKLSRKPRKKADRLWAQGLRRLRLGGIRKNPQEAEGEWAKALDGRCSGIYTFYQGAAAARFAPLYGREEFIALKEQYRLFDREYKKIISPGRRLLAWLLPPLALVLPPGKPDRFPGAGPAGKGAAGSIGGLCLIVLLLSLTGDGAGAQNQAADGDTLFKYAQDAQNAEQWERAMELYSQGAGLYPEDVRFPWALGNLYYDRKLYHLAWDEFRGLERLLPNDPELLYYLSRIAGYLNENRISAEYLKRLLILEPDNREAIGNLGWMYYKIHHLEEGRQLLENAIERFGPDADFAMTLGTINSDMFRYSEGKNWYLAAIAEAEAIGDRLFAAVAHYNLSILETRFYYFDLAFDRTGDSLTAMNRPSGRLARGELFLRQLELPRSLSEYQEAYEIDPVPLSKVNLAQIFQIGGRLEEARLYAEDCLRSEDLSWMLNYGIDPVEYKRDLHEILYKTYKGLEKTEGFMMDGTLREQVQGFFREISCRFKSAVHRRLFQKYSLLSANAYQRDTSGEPHLDALIQYYNAFKSYPRRSLNYLTKAREFEISLITQAEPSYDLEEGGLIKNANLIKRALTDFDPVWERDMIADAYAELALTISKTQKTEVRDAAERLFALNRGGLRQRGIKLPAEVLVEISGSGFAKSSFSKFRAQKALEKAIIKAGITPIPAGPSGERTNRTDRGNGGRFILYINAREPGQTVLCELYDENRGTAVISREIPLASLSSAGLSAFSRTLGDAIFNGF
jgi:tetratricopeptide (TPR) repeat protein